MSRTRNIVSLALAALFIVGAFTPVAGTSVPATASQENAIKAAIVGLGGNTGPKGLNTLQGDWQTFNEIHTIYALNTGAAGYSGLATGNTHYTYNLYDPRSAITLPTTDASSAVRGHGDLSFPYGVAAAPGEIYRLSANVFVASATTFRFEAQVTANGTVIASVPLVSGGNPANPIGTGVRSTPTESTASVFFDPPVKFSRGAALAINFHALPGTTNTADTLQIQYGHASEPTRVVISTDSARVSTWTENPSHQVATNFAASTASAPIDRTVLVPLAHVSSLGDISLFTSTNAQRHTLRVIGPDSKVYYDNTGASKDLPNEVGTVNVPAAQEWGAVRDDLARTAPGESAAGNNLAVGQPGLNFVEYRLTYPGGIPEGLYTIEVGAVGQAWKVTQTVAVGGVGSALALSPLEQSATKEILIGQRTTYRVIVTNMGGTTDSFALTASPSPVPVGWSASPSPASLTLAPGASGEAVVTVTPSSSGANGELNVIHVAATSLTSGRASPNLDLTVKLTNTAQQGVRILTDSTSARVAPGAVRSFPFVVENSGNAKARFVASVTGVPLGWTASITPSLFELDAKSQNAAVLTLSAPTDAVRGQTFTLTLGAAAIDNSAVKATKTVDIQVFLVDKFSFVLDDGVNADGTMKPLATTTVTAPQVHFLRDEGPDADTTSQSCPLGVPTCPLLESTSTAWDGNVDPDRDYDQSTLFRLVLVNDGDRPDKISLTPKLVTSGDARSDGLATAAQKNALGYQDFDGCEEATNGNDAVGDGLNDGWRFRIFDPTNTTQVPIAAGGRATKQSYDMVSALGRVVPVPAHSVRYVYAEMAVYDGDPDSSNNEDCVSGSNLVQDPGAAGVAGSRFGDAAPGHAVAIEAVSQNDPSQRNTHFLNAKVKGAGSGGTVASGSPGTPPSRIGPQTYSDQQLGTAVEIEANEKTLQNVVSGGSLAERTGTFRVRAVNTANEMDTLRITVPQFTNPSNHALGWERSLAGFNTKLMFKNAVTGNSGGGENPVCTPAAVSGDDLLVDCTMGAFDEVSFLVNDTAPEAASIGAADVFTVKVASKDSQSGATIIANTLPLTTKVLGAFAFNLLPDANSVQLAVFQNGTVSTPFTLDNIGTNADHYTMDTVIQPAVTSGWYGNFSQATPIAVPGAKQFNGVFTVKAPKTAAVGSVERFRIRATDADTPSATKLFDFLDVDVTVVARPTAYTMTGDPGNVGGLPGQTLTLGVKATRGAGNSATGVTFMVDPASLPAGWSTVGATTATASYVNGDATASFQVQSPAGALGTSRAVVRVNGKDSGNVANFAEIGVALSSPNLGITLYAPSGNRTEVASGTSVQVPITVANRGLGTDGVTMAALGVPANWGVAFNPSVVGLQPLENKTVLVTVNAPANLAAGSSVVFNVKATPGDVTQAQTLQLAFTVGTSLLRVVPTTNRTVQVGPEEPVRWVVSVSNNGTIGDDVKLSLATQPAFKDLITATFTPATLSLQPGQAQQVAVEAKLPTALIGGTSLVLGVKAHSIGPLLNSTGLGNVTVHLLDFAALDVDGDLGNEYAVDRDQVAANGFEEFRDPASTATASKLWDLDGVIGAATRARLALPLTGAVTPFVDGDGDGKADFFVDRDGDKLPDAYWDPDNHVLTPTTLRVDLVGTPARDIPVDVDGDKLIDKVYDPEQAVFIPVLKIDLDGDKVPDFVVDVNANGKADPGEPILYGAAGGKIAKITRLLDVDGDGKLDAVVDADADGNPDYFLSEGTGTAIPIVLRDVNGDGTKDWTFDSNGDGKEDKYYDPVTGETHTFTEDQAFLSGLARFWYVGVLLLVAIAAFVVLLVVRRKQ